MLIGRFARQTKTVMMVKINGSSNCSYRRSENSAIDSISPRMVMMMMMMMLLLLLQAWYTLSAPGWGGRLVSSKVLGDQNGQEKEKRCVKRRRSRRTKQS